jgi:mannose-1-phosphate guanylyltransferase
MSDKTPELFIVLMAGGSGTRLWPMSTSERPKQLLALVGERSLIQQTVDRSRALTSPERIVVLTNARFQEAIRQQLPELPPENVVAEPVARDTSGAVALAAVIGKSRFPDDVMVVLPADHIIRPDAEFTAAVRSAAVGAAGSDALYTFGIKPTYPATGYGYLERGKPVVVPGLSGDAAAGHYRLERFREKPDRETARAFVESGRFFWNSGMFVWRNDTIWRNIEAHLPEHAELLGPLIGRFGQQGFDQALADAFAPLPKISIDFGVMEKADDVRMVETAFEWFDVGGWPAMRDFLPADEAGNAYRGQLEIVAAKDNLVFCEDPQETVALVGVEGVVVVRSGDRTLVMAESQAQQVKTLVNQLEKK